MANPEHLEIFKSGFDNWNKWRDENPEIIPDLSQENLEKFNLMDFILDKADLRKTKLTNSQMFWMNLAHANLSGANLSNANLTFTILQYANLSETNLSRVQFINARLEYANISSADCGKTNFLGANLTGVDFTNAVLGYTILVDANLTDAKGLESIVHETYSGLDYQTIIKSGQLPLEFLRGCGLPDTLINYLPSLLNNPIEFYSCFISYSSKNHDFAERLYADLQNNGVRCWFAPEDMKIGDEIRHRIDESIRLYDKLLLILSEESINSEWVEAEVETALEKEGTQKRVVLFPIRLDDSIMDSDAGWAAHIRRTRHIGDFTSWKNHDSYQKGFERLLRDLKATA